MNWILSNWRDILSICCTIAAFVFFILKKKPVKIVDTLKQCIYQNLPYWIRKAEEAGSRNRLTGNEKLQFVLHEIEDFCTTNGCEFTDFYRKWAVNAIESILDTPRKK